MRIVIDARTIADHFPGIGRYTYNLLLALSRIDHGHEIVALTCPSLKNTRYDLAALRVQLISTTAQIITLAEQWQVPKLLWREHADLFHATYYVQPYGRLPCPVVTTLYDTIPHRFPRTVSWRARILFDLLHRLAIWRSAQLLTISHSAQADLMAAYRIPESRIDVTPLAADPQFQPQSAAQIANLRDRYQLPERYVLTLASDKPHKNIAGLLQIWKACQQQQLMPILVLAGHRDSPATTLQPLTAFGPHEIRELPNIPAADMPALYAGAELFLFPSLYEGFGLPALEALACGTPVICGHNSSMPEVVGTSGILVDLADTVAWVRAICSTLNDSTLRMQLHQAALAQAARFSWELVAQGSLLAYAKALH